MNTVYKIRNKKTGEFWFTGKQKGIWFQKNHAKSAWCEWENRGTPYRDRVYFDEQDEYEIVECVVIPKERLKELEEMCYKRYCEDI